MTTNTPACGLPVLPHDASELIDSILQTDRRILFYGPPGVGKTTLAGQLANALQAMGRNSWCLSADPGSPGFGVPGAVALGRWQAQDWRLEEMEALCSLDAGRFRLPLISAVRRLARRPFDGVLLLDGPGVVRGMAGRELLPALVDAAQVDVVLALSAAGRCPPLPDELHSLAAEVYMVHAADVAQRPGKRSRARRRTEQWESYLGEGETQQLELSRFNLIGTPPPLEQAGAWAGRQIALLRGQQTLVMGEIQSLRGNRLQASLPTEVEAADTLLIRDAQRSVAGMLETAAPFAAERLAYLPPADVLPAHVEGGGARVAGRVGAVDVSLVNGVFGDPLLHMRVRHQRRSLLFDLGEGERLPGRLAHQVSDVFISHAHLDHIGGFLWLVRSRIGEFPPCRLYGPPGLARHIEGFLQGVLWDRIGDRGPAFEVTECHPESTRRYFLQAGVAGCRLLKEFTPRNDVLLEESAFRVRAVSLDHRGTSVLAYAFEPAKQINIRKDRLSARGLAPGAWLGELKRHLLAEEEAAVLRLPDGTQITAGELGAELAIISSGKRLVYATDFADTEDNRRRLVALARSAHTLFCEATFAVAETEQATRHGHLTTRACAEIAEAAGVARLIPFHFSRRYADTPQRMYEEIETVCSRVVVPASMDVFETAT